MAVNFTNQKASYASFPQIGPLSPRVREAALRSAQRRTGSACSVILQEAATATRKLAEK